MEASNLPDLIEIMKSWFKSCENEDKLVTRRALAHLLIRLDLAQEMETAQSMITIRLTGINTEERYI